MGIELTDTIRSARFCVCGFAPRMKYAKGMVFKRELSMRKLSLLFLLAACTSGKSDSTPQTSPAGSGATTASASATEAPIQSADSAIAPEVNPPGDIPDTQAFVKYTSSAGGYRLDVPEGWARTESGNGVTFVDKFDGVKISVSPATSAPTAATARATEAKQIESQGHAVKINSVTDITLPSGKAVRISYASNSDANSVTGKRVRQENETYLYYHNGKVAALTLYAPQGADNVDQWVRMSRSFNWL